VARVAAVALDGAPLRIAAISDTHVGGPHVDVARVVRVVRDINALHPDLVVLLGDYGAGHLPEDEVEPSLRDEILRAASRRSPRYGLATESSPCSATTTSGMAVRASRSRS
jgi:hypothetical protein